MPFKSIILISDIYMYLSPSLSLAHTGGYDKNNGPKYPMATHTV